VTADLLADDAIPTVEVPRSEAIEMQVADLFVRAGLSSSRGDARRVASQGGLSIGDIRISTVDSPVETDGGAVLLRAGKKRFVRVRFTDA
jgi:tyrosyl-tRNA synthetase